MPTVRIPIDLNWSGATGSPGVNVWHARFDGAEPPFADLDGITSMLFAFYDSLEGLYPDTMTVSYGGEAAGVGAAEGNTYTSSAWFVQGIGGPTFAPPANQMFVNWRALTGGRRGRGRTYLGPLSGSTLEANGTPGETYRATAQAAADNLVSASQGDLNGAVVVYSRLDGIARDITSGNVPNMFAVLRSRRD